MLTLRIDVLRFFPGYESLLGIYEIRMHLVSFTALVNLAAYFTLTP